MPQQTRFMVIIFLFVCFTASVYSFDKDLKGSIGLRGNEVILWTSTPKFVNTELVNVLRSGVALTVSYEVRVYQNGFFSWMVIKKKLTYQKSLSFDIQANIYVMRSPGQVVKNSDFKTVLESFYAEDAITIGRVAEFKPGLADHYIRYRLSTETIKLYPPLSLIFSFIDIYNFTTSWFTLDMEKKK
jgi:hypothetical protein